MPAVAIVSPTTGQPLSAPLRRDTSQREHEIVGILDAHAGADKVKAGTLIALAAARIALALVE